LMGAYVRFAFACLRCIRRGANSGQQKSILEIQEEMPKNREQKANATLLPIPPECSPMSSPMKTSPTKSSPINAADLVGPSQAYIRCNRGHECRFLRTGTCTFLHTRQEAEAAGVNPDELGSAVGHPDLAHRPSELELVRPQDPFCRHCTVGGLCMTRFPFGMMSSTFLARCSHSLLGCGRSA
jgi:hypothetical protein